MAVETTSRGPMGAADWARLVGLSVLWGGSFFFNAIAVAELPPLVVVVARVGIAAVLLWAVVLRLGVAVSHGPALWAAFLAMGALNNAVPFSLIVWGQTHLASGVASILNATTPLFTVLAAHVFTRDERLSARKLAGVALGFAGVVATIGPAALDRLAGEGLAAAAILAAALAYACAGIFGRRFSAMGVPPLVTAAGQVTASTVLLLPVTLIVDRPWMLAAPSPTALLALGAIAALSTALAYVLYFRILASAGATNLLLVTFLIPVTAVLLGVLILGEALSPGHVLGMALVGAGLALVDGRLTRRWFPTRAAAP